MKFKPPELLSRAAQVIRLLAKQRPPPPPSPELTSYLRATRSLPHPTVQQMDAFAEFVCNSHSWYKHLPLLPPGRPLQFFIDPAAGMQLRLIPDGSVVAEPRLEPGFHYSWLRTAEYRERFGYLAFSREHGTIVSLHKGDGSQLVGSDDAHRYFDCNAGVVRPLPCEVLRAGRAFVSAVIHTMGSREFVFDLDRIPADVPWPAQSGGSATLAKILERSRYLKRNQSRWEPPTEEEQLRRDPNLFLVDMPLHQLVEPERRRQCAGMVRAMRRVSRMVGGNPAPVEEKRTDA